MEARVCFSDEDPGQPKQTQTHTRHASLSLSLECCSVAQSTNRVRLALNPYFFKHANTLLAPRALCLDSALVSHPEWNHESRMSTLLWLICFPITATVTFATR